MLYRAYASRLQLQLFLLITPLVHIPDFRIQEKERVNVNFLESWLRLYVISPLQEKGLPF